MPERSSELSPSLNERREARKKFLVLACSLDRVELALAWQRPAKPANPILGGLSGIFSGPWWQVARTVVTPFLPKKIRAAALLYRMWRSRSQG